MSTKRMPSLLLIPVAAYILYLSWALVAKSGTYFWDFKVYYFAAKAHSMGLNPYIAENLFKAGHRDSLRFIYPPHALLLFKPFLLFDLDTAIVVFQIAKYICLLALVYLWLRSFLDEHDLYLFVPFMLFAFNGALYLDLRAGNLTVMEQLCLWVGFACLLKGNRILFAALIVILASIKVFPALFLLLLLTTTGKAKYWVLSGAALALALIFLASYSVSPGLFVSFLDNSGGVLQAERGIGQPSTLALIRDVIAIANKYASIAAPERLDLVLYGLAALLVISVYIKVCVAAERARLVDRGKLLLFIFCIVYAMILPRFKDYYYMLLIVPAYYVIRRERYVSQFALLFAAMIISSPLSPLPWMNLFYAVFWEYYPLLLAYGLFMLYVGYVGREARKLRSFDRVASTPPS